MSPVDSRLSAFRRLRSRSTSVRGVREEKQKAGASKKKASARNAELTAREECLTQLKTFVTSKSPHILRAWFQYFDRTHRGLIYGEEFQSGMKALSYPFSIEGLWESIDINDENELVLDDLDVDLARSWRSFRRWCGEKFESSRDFIYRLKQTYASAHGPLYNTRGVASEQEIVEGLVSHGWERGFAAVLFGALDLGGDGSIASRDVKFLEKDILLKRQKEAAKRQARNKSDYQAKRLHASRTALRSFKAFLQAKYGPLFCAWRHALDVDGTMTLPKAELFKVCQKLHWHGNPRDLWQSLDTNGSGSATFEEFDPFGAELLAHFMEWSAATWGPKPSMAMYRALDHHHTQRLKVGQFIQECEARHFHGDTQAVAHCLLPHGRKYFVAEDFQFLDSWKPPTWVLAKANAKAAEDFKAQLLAKYGHYVRAWRALMDKDSSNTCNWHEFQKAAKSLKFSGDVAGVFRAFDDDLSGTISLKEIDEDAHGVLTTFKQWADEEFGGVRLAFKIMDSDKSGKIEYREFRLACRNFGFDGDVDVLFGSLDQQNEQILQYEEVIFLDSWDTSANEPVAAEPSAEAEHPPPGGSPREKPRLPDRFCEGPLSAKRSQAPGPGSYNVLSGIGAPQRHPTARHGGCFTFGGKPKSSSICPEDPLDWSTPPGPHTYRPSVGVYAKRMPAWSFMSSDRLRPTQRDADFLPVVA